MNFYFVWSNYLLVDLIVGAFIHPPSARDMGPTKFIWLIIGRHCNSENGSSSSPSWQSSRGWAFITEYDISCHIYILVSYLSRRCGFWHIITGNALEVRWDFKRVVHRDQFGIQPTLGWKGGPWSPAKICLRGCKSHCAVDRGGNQMGIFNFSMIPKWILLAFQYIRTGEKEFLNLVTVLTLHIAHQNF